MLGYDKANALLYLSNRKHVGKSSLLWDIGTNMGPND